VRWTATAAAHWPIVPMFLTVTTALVPLVIPVMALPAQVISVAANAEYNITERLFAVTSVMHVKHSFRLWHFQYSLRSE